MKKLLFLPILLLLSCSSDPESTIENTFLEKEWILTVRNGIPVSCERNFIEETWKFRTDGVWSIKDNCSFNDFGAAGFWDFNENGFIKPREFGVYFVFVELKKSTVTIEFYNNLDDLVETSTFENSKIR